MGITHWALQEIVWVVRATRICGQTPLLCKEGKGEVETPDAKLTANATGTMT